MKIIGHRGAAGLAPENTLASFEKAVEHGVDELELDVRVTKDNIVVVHHHSYVLLPDGSRIIIADHTLQELLKYKADLLTFQGLINQFGAPVPLMVEVKRGEPYQPIASVLKWALEVKLRPNDISLASFDFALLQQLHRQFPDVPVVVNESWSGTRGALRARSLDTYRLNMRASWLWRGFLRSMQSRGYQIAAYTVNDPAKIRPWRKYLYGVITDRPDLFENLKK